MNRNLYAKVGIVATSLLVPGGRVALPSANVSDAVAIHQFTAWPTSAEPSTVVSRFQQELSDQISVPQAWLDQIANSRAQYDEDYSGYL